jgi:hypothetical protein
MLGTASVVFQRDRVGQHSPQPFHETRNGPLTRRGPLALHTFFYPGFPEEVVRDGNQAEAGSASSSSPASALVLMTAIATTNNPNNGLARTSPNE